MDATTQQPAEPPVLIGADRMPIDNWHNLNRYERTKALARAKQQYEGLYPETCHGGKRAAGTARGGPAPFVDYAGERLVPNKNRDTISKYARIGAKLIDLPEALEHHPLVNNLKELELLSKARPETQKVTVEKLLSGEVKTVKDALPQNNRQRTNHRPVQSCATSHSNGNGRPMPLRERIDYIVDEVRNVVSLLNGPDEIGNRLSADLFDLQQAKEAEAESRCRQREVRPTLPPIPRSAGYQPGSLSVGGVI